MSFYIPSNIYPVGNVITCRFCFTNRPLTDSEKAIFLATGVLPINIGIDQPVVFADWWIDSGEVNTLSGSSVIRDAAGAYHVNITAHTPGNYYYRGYSHDAQGTDLASTATLHFTAE